MFIFFVFFCWIFFLETIPVNFQYDCDFVNTSINTNNRPPSFNYNLSFYIIWYLRSFYLPPSSLPLIWCRNNNRWKAKEISVRFFFAYYLQFSFCFFFFVINKSYSVDFIFFFCCCYKTISYTAKLFFTVLFFVRPCYQALQCVLYWFSLIMKLFVNFFPFCFFKI